MKLKRPAEGDKGLPQTERTYFNVLLPKEGKDSSLPMFFCSKWSVGKLVDYAASLASLKNNNNTERTYFNVFLPKEGKDSSLPMFFCSKWSVGKLVDYAASLASLKNNNNVLTAKLKENSH
ncbi:AN1-type zinc finger protein 1-like isoform 1-T1 [Salvelinus alpinus]